jgi:hypothetical protein
MGQLICSELSFEGDLSTNRPARIEGIITPSECAHITSNRSGSNICHDDGATTSQLSFSFCPGDDSTLLLEDSVQNLTSKTKPPEHLSHKATSTTEQPSKTVSVTRDGTNDIRSHAKLNTKSEAMARTNIPVKHRDQQRSDPLSREDSFGSAITAVRDSSGRSSNSSITQGFRNTGKNIGSVEAMTAAAKAFGARK